MYDFGYPHPGLVQHFDYAVAQRLLGQRGQIGAVTGGLNRPIGDQLLGAALATGAHVSLGSDLGFVAPEGFAALRAHLVHYRPFAGETPAGPEFSGLCPSWAATSVGDLTFVGLINRSAAPQRVEVRLADLPDARLAGGDSPAYDVAAERPVGVREALAADLPGQSFRLFVLRRPPGVFWTTSSYEAETQQGGWRVTVRGPVEVAGHLQFYLPGGPPRQVSLDGRQLGPPAPGGGEGATYDPATQVLSIRYLHASRGARRTARGQAVRA